MKVCCPVERACDILGYQTYLLVSLEFTLGGRTMLRDLLLRTLSIHPIHTLVVELADGFA
jgi:hydrogenase-4 membrane subunit HyfE